MRPGARPALALSGLVLSASVWAVACTSPAPPEGPDRSTGTSTSAPIGTPSPADPSAGPTTGPTGSGGPTGSATTTPIPEPTTTNTLPPPPAPTRPAPSTAGDLDARSLPVPTGWRTVAREGGEEDGYLGNGTWVHQRDPRYAAFDAITIGCAPVTRDDYRDPTAALEGTYDRSGAPGIGLVLQFATAAQATAYFDLYVRQVQACSGPDAPVRISQVRIVREQGREGLVDRRTYDDGEWTEVARAVDRRVTLIILSDPGHRTTAAQTEELLDRIR